ncbi:MAG: B12-binding domain-containing radical SAM protein [Oscillospiraceae bacterium]|nr:B12-binding domain-containing radical SAM protein [Oscillospiraceae bacterium]
MKILLIAPVKDIMNKTVEMIRFPMISLLYIAAATPGEHEVSIVEEETETLDFNVDCDLVGITCMTATAPRAYAIAAAFRKRGKTVVLGGIHPTVLPNEAISFCDSVVTGEAVPVWAQLLKDFENGCLQEFYAGGAAANIDEYPLPRRDLIKPGTVLGMEPILTSCGCPYSCEFCSVWKFYGKRIRHVSIENVLKDIDNSKTSRFMFLDDNIVGDPAYAKSLFFALKDRKIKWVGQASISFAKNEELLKLAHDSGCKGLFFGVESVSEEKIKRMGKSMRTQEGTIDAIKRIMGHGIFFHASLVFGFDDDDESVFDETLEFLHKTKIPSATFNVLTPYPGTDIFEQFKSQNRLITEDWKLYDHCTVTYQPNRMSVEKLVEGYQYVKRSYYSFGSILSRFPASIRNPLIFSIANIGIKKSIKVIKEPESKDGRRYRKAAANYESKF